MRHVDTKIMQNSIETILNLIGLVNDRQTLSKELSGGMKRRLSIGIALIGDPKVSHLNKSVLFHFYEYCLLDSYS